MAQKKPSLTTKTKLNNHHVTDSKVPTLRKVSYIFNATSAKNLSIPYVVAVNGKPLADYATKPRRVSGAKGVISVMVKPGDKVSLFLNSDAHPSYRKEAVYEVCPLERDIEVTVTEKKGKHADSDTPTRVLDKDAAAEAAKKADTYSAPLTGDIWMKVSHKYTSGEVDALMPTGTAAEIIAAVKNIYTGLKSHTLTLDLPASKNKGTMSITVTFDDSENPRENIVKYSLLADGLTRVHPAGYASLFNAAVEADITKLTMSSAWRPMLGSIAHRAGLGLDVNYLGSMRLNREELRKKSAVDTDNVSEEEKRLFKEFEAAEAEEAKADKIHNISLKNMKTFKNDPIKGPEAAKSKQEAEKVLEAATRKRVMSRDAWNDERNKNEPASVKQFRNTLMKCPCVSQLFDPWYMDGNTHDIHAAEANMQKTKNETLHAHHLHITVNEPKIL